jgi:hypothetical protein
LLAALDSLPASTPPISRRRATAFVWQVEGCRTVAGAVGGPDQSEEAGKTRSAKSLGRSETHECRSATPAPNNPYRPRAEYQKGCRNSLAGRMPDRGEQRCDRRRTRSHLRLARGAHGCALHAGRGSAAPCHGCDDEIGRRKNSYSLTRGQGEGPRRKSLMISFPEVWDGGGCSLPKPVSKSKIPC